MGTYEPLIELASGGMGVVAIARRVGDAGFERLVVTKRVHPHLLLDPSFRKMIRDEALLLSRVHDAHVVSILDVVETDGELSLVLEYVESLTLAALVTLAKKEGARIPLSITARIVVDALLGLQAAHEGVDDDGRPLGIIHRDVSPQNIVVGFDGSSRLIDFGIAKATTLRDETKDDTTTGVIKGKVRYMSPEQMKNSPLDRRTDVFSAGIVLYETITGERVVRADNDGDLLLSMLLGDFHPPTHWVPDLPKALESATMKALALDRDDRYATAADFSDAIERAVTVAPTREVAQLVNHLGGKMIAERRALLRDRRRSTASLRPPPPSPPSSVATTLAAPRTRAKRNGVALATLLVALAGTAIAFGFAKRHGAPGAAPVAVTSASADLGSVDPPSAPSDAPSAATSSTPVVASALPANSSGRTSKNHIAPHGPPSRGTPIAPKNPCIPNYNVLPDGTHRFKPQCVE